MTVLPFLATQPKMALLLTTLPKMVLLLTTLLKMVLLLLLTTTTKPSHKS